MANRLSQDETETLGLILDDLKLLFQKDVIPVDEIDGVVGQLKSDEVRAYLNHLKSGSKPEVALREAFFAGRSILSKYLAADISPEVNLGEGFIDYQIGSGGRFILLELKTLFEAEVVHGKTGKELKALRQRPLEWENHKEQILKYIRKGGEYIVLTNLKEWYFFNDECNPDRCAPFHTTDLFSFLKDFEVSPNLYERLERYDFESIREELDKRFFESLKAWVKKLSEVEFDVDEKRKLEIIIGLINRFVFIQTLDDYGVIHFRWIKNAWDYAVQRWSAKGKLQVLKEFFREVNEWFYEYYDTELFRNEVLEHIKVDDENVNLFYRNLELVLGLAYWQTPIGGFRGIIQYNFRFIDEDIFGKAYETFLAEVRKEQGIFYTPRYITEYIVENTVGRIFDELLQQIKKELEAENFESIPPLIERFKSMRILDPACGSGSFLIKATRKIFEKYRQLYELLDTFLNKYDQFNGTLFRPQNSEYKAARLMQIREAIVETSERELICKILVRHIHGNDLDAKALEVAKVNLWLEAIKLAPSEFRFDRLPSNTNHVLPSLTFNLCNGDSLIGLPEEFTMKYLNDKHQTDLIKLINLRQKYLENPMNPELVEEIEDIKHKIRNELDENFKEYVEAKGISTQIVNQTKPFHWALEFWHVFFNEDGILVPEEKRGFDVIIGNPPYIEYRVMARKLGLEYTTFLKSEYKLAQGQFDITIPFTEKPFRLLKKGGMLSYIMTNKFMVAEYGYNLRKYLLTHQVLCEIIDVSNIRVFKDAATYPVVFNVKRVDGDLEYSIRIGSPSEEEMISRSPPLSVLPKSIFTSDLPLYILTPYITNLSLKVFEKTRSGSPIQENLVKCGVAQTGFSDKIKSSVEAKEGDYIQFVQGEDITSYYVIPPNKYFPSSLLSREKLMEFKQSKIMIPGMVKEIYCGYDTIGYGCGRVYYITQGESPYPLSYLAALFNSTLFKFIYRLAYGMSHLSGDYLRINSPYLRIFNVKEIDGKTSNWFEDRINHLMSLKRAHYKFLDTWIEWCTRLKNDECSLHKVLSEDARFIRIGEFNKAWTSKATFYSTKPETLNVIFNDFKISGEISKHVMRIYGLDENNREELVYEMEFGNRELMLNIYCSLLQALGSKAKVKTFSQLLTKTIVPIIKEVNRSPNELTPNIVKKVKDEFEKWLKEEKIENVEADIVKIDNEIEDLEAEIDALVFKLYGLNEDEIKTVFDFLKTPTIYQGKVLEFFKVL